MGINFLELDHYGGPAMALTNGAVLALSICAGSPAMTRTLLLNLMGYCGHDHDKIVNLHKFATDVSRLLKEKYATADPVQRLALYSRRFQFTPPIPLGENFFVQTAETRSVYCFFFF